MITEKSFNNANATETFETGSAMFQCLKDIKMGQEGEEPNQNFTLLLVEEYIKDFETENAMEFVTKALEKLGKSN